MAISIYNYYPAGAANLPLELCQIRVLIAHMLITVSKAQKSLANVELYLVDDREIARLNANFLACQGPTNILSFPESVEKGCLYLSADTYRRECLLYNQDKISHLLALLAHGIAHLTGLDHGLEMDSLVEGCLSSSQNFLRQTYYEQ